MTILRHLHLPNVVSYQHAAELQQRLVANLLAYKAKGTLSPTSPPPPPTIITAQFHPVYTCGRREIGTVSPAQRSYLAQSTPLGQASFIETLRGGQTTFHGPGQLIAYPIIDLRQHALTPRCYVRLLENTVIDTCKFYGIQTKTTEHPGVWVNDEEKICAVGVHLRRHISSHGTGLNVDTELGWFDRIVGCGLEGKRTTSLERQGVRVEGGVEEVAKRFVRFFGERLEGVEERAVRIGEEDVD
ncbi:Putative biotinyl protein ligase (BPL) and lipoyl protein ligase (LPL), catalytic [Septoria linicola]|uniref:Octanoyltransferase n=1 Tax=Septoria linicola TaxID=215465 RepID=A0A9Q9ARG0_9PEZI|nr:Putative biotinyl protein ligase (BPL) and lipoyl protein ligase (LPL), catalytic [Septoria linicola]